MEAISRTAHGIAARTTPQAKNNSTADPKKVSQGRGVFLIHLAEGKHHTVKTTSRTLRILPQAGAGGAPGFNKIQTLDGGVWETVFTSPFGFDVTIVPEDF